MEYMIFVWVIGSMIGFGMTAFDDRVQDFPAPFTLAILLSALVWPVIIGVKFKDL